MKIKNAIIVGATIEINDHGFLDSWIHLDYGGGIQQGFGGYVLGVPQDSKHWEIKSVAGHWIRRVMEVADVEKWGNLRGKTIRVKGSHVLGTTIDAIGHIVKDDWFCPKEDFAELNK